MNESLYHIYKLYVQDNFELKGKQSFGAPRKKFTDVQKKVKEIKTVSDPSLIDLAAKYNDLQSLKLFLNNLDKSANINSLNLSSSYNSKYNIEDMPKCIELLLKNGADANLNSNLNTGTDLNKNKKKVKHSRTTSTPPVLERISENNSGLLNEDDDFMLENKPRPRRKSLDISRTRSNNSDNEKYTETDTRTNWDKRSESSDKRSLDHINDLIDKSIIGSPYQIHRPKTENIIRMSELDESVELKKTMTDIDLLSTSLLMKICEDKNAEVLKLVLKYGKDLDLENNDILRKAYELKDMNLIKAILSERPDLVNNLDDEEIKPVKRKRGRPKKSDAPDINARKLNNSRSPSTESRKQNHKRSPSTESRKLDRNEDVDSNKNDDLNTGERMGPVQSKSDKKHGHDRKNTDEKENINEIVRRITTNESKNKNRETSEEIDIETNEEEERIKRVIRNVKCVQNCCIDLKMLIKALIVLIA